MTSEQNPASNRTTAAIASQSLTRSTPKHRVPLRAVLFGVFSSPVIIFAFHKTSRGSRSSPVRYPSPRFESLIEERRVILRSVSSARAVSVARSSPEFRVSKISAPIHSSPYAPPFGLSKPDGRRPPEPGPIRNSESCTPKFIRASERGFPTQSKIAAKCVQCGTGHAISTQRTHWSRNSRSLTA